MRNSQSSQSSSSSSSTAIMLQDLQEAQPSGSIASISPTPPNATPVFSMSALYKEYLEHFCVSGDFLSIDTILQLCYAKINLFERSEYIHMHIALKKWFSQYPLDQNGQPIPQQLMLPKMYKATIDIVNLVIKVVDNHLTDPQKHLSLDGLYQAWRIADSLLLMCEDKYTLLQKLASCYKNGQHVPGYDKQQAIFIYSQHLGYLLGSFFKEQSTHQENTIEKQLFLLDAYFSWHNVLTKTADLNFWVETSNIETVQMMLKFLVEVDQLYETHISHIYKKMHNIKKLQSHTHRLLEDETLEITSHAKQVLALIQLITKRRSWLSCLDQHEANWLTCIMLREQFFQHWNMQFDPPPIIKTQNEQAITSLQEKAVALKLLKSQHSEDRNLIPYEQMLSELNEKLRSLHKKSQESQDEMAIKETWEQAQQIIAADQQVKESKEKKRNKKKEKAQKQKLLKQKQEWEEIKAKRKQVEEEQQAHEQEQKKQHIVTSVSLEEHHYYKKYFSAIANTMHHALSSKETRFNYNVDGGIYSKFVQQINESIRTLPMILNTIDWNFNAEIKKENFCATITEMLKRSEPRFKHFFKQHGSENDLTEILWKLLLSYFGIAEHYLLWANTNRDLIKKSIYFLRTKDNYQRSFNVLNLLEKMIHLFVQDDAITLKNIQALRTHHQCICDILKTDIHDINHMITQRLKRMYAERKAAKKRYQEQGKDWQANKSFAEISPAAQERLHLKQLQTNIQATLAELDNIHAIDENNTNEEDRYNVDESTVLKSCG